MQSFGSESERLALEQLSLLVLPGHPCSGQPKIDMEARSETSSCISPDLDPVTNTRGVLGSEASSSISQDLDPVTKTKNPNSKRSACSGRSGCLVLHERFVASGPTRIDLKECNKFHDAKGELLFRVCAKVVTMSGRIAVKDSGGAHVGHVRGKRTPCPRATYYVGNKKKDKILTLKAKGMKTKACPKSKAKACPNECDTDIYLGDALIGQIIGNWFIKSFKIYVLGIQVVEASRGPGCVEGGFYIDVTTAGVDTSLVVTVVLALGQIYEWADSCNGGVCSNFLSGFNFKSRPTISTFTSSGNVMGDRLFVT